MSGEKFFTITLQGDHSLTVEEIWPDGDAPDNPTDADVVAVLKKYSLSDLISDWNCGCDVMVGRIHLTSYGLHDNLRVIRVLNER